MAAMEITAKTSIWTRIRRTVLFISAIGLILFGFAVDGASEAGHHAGFILGGIALGLGLARK